MDSATKRIIKDMQILQKNKEDLNARGIYVRSDEANVRHIDILIVPRDKREDDLISPYTFGNFMFDLRCPDDYPLTPPQITFYPQQRLCRLHPNYYEIGKVCLSVINTWGQDWSPATSILSIINVLEERFNENAICFEPSYENASRTMRSLYNQAVEYAKYKVCLMDIQRCPLYKRFEEEICLEIKKNAPALLKRLEDLRDTYGDSSIVTTPCFSYTIKCDYSATIEAFKRCYSL
jgi:ubiquitin-protein ligase